MFLQDLRYLPACSGCTQNHYLQPWKQVQKWKSPLQEIRGERIKPQQICFWSFQGDILVAFDCSKAMFQLFLTVPRRYFSCFDRSKAIFMLLLNISRCYFTCLWRFQGDISAAFNRSKATFQLLLTIPRWYFSCFCPFQGDISAAFNRFKAIFQLLLTVSRWYFSFYWPFQGLPLTIPRQYLSCFWSFQGDFNWFWPFQDNIAIAFDRFKVIFQLLLTIPRRYLSCFWPFQGDISVAFDRSKAIFQLHALFFCSFGFQGSAVLCCHVMSLNSCVTNALERLHSVTVAFPGYPYSRPSLSRILMNALKYFEISVPWHIRFAEVK